MVTKAQNKPVEAKASPPAVDQTETRVVVKKEAKVKKIKRPKNKLVINKAPMGLLEIGWSEGGKVPAELVGKFNNRLMATNLIKAYKAKQ